MSHNRSLVIIGNSTQGLGIIRSASSLGIKRYVVNDKIFCSSRNSKYLTKYLKLNPGTIFSLAESVHSEHLTETLLNLPIEYPSALLGVNEDIINYIAANSEILGEKYHIPLNDYKSIFDKYLFNKLLPDENQIFTELIEKVNLDTLNPTNYLIKSRIGNKFRNRYNRKAIFIKDLTEEMKSAIESEFSGDELIVQELIESKESVLSCCGFTIDGELKGLFQYEKVRQHPDRFGTGTYLKSIYNPEILETAKIIWSKLKYTGISEIEFLLNDKNKKYKVIEMNPRTWKSVDFATKCGQNLVEKYVQFILGFQYDTGIKFEINKYWTDLFTDVIQMLRERKIFKYHVNDLYECTWDKKDPMPFITSIVSSPFILFKI